MMALRLMLAAGFSASEEAHLELLAYQFFEEVSPQLNMIRKDFEDYESSPSL